MSQQAVAGQPGPSLDCTAGLIPQTASRAGIPALPWPPPPYEHCQWQGDGCGTIGWEKPTESRAWAPAVAADGATL